MQLFNIICNIYTLTPIDGGTKIQCLLERSSVVGCDSLSEVKEEMRSRFSDYLNPPAPSGHSWNLKTAIPFCEDSYRLLVFDMLVPKGVVGERREFYITKAII